VGKNIIVLFVHVTFFFPSTMFLVSIYSMFGMASCMNLRLSSKRKTICGVVF